MLDEMAPEWIRWAVIGGGVVALVGAIGGLVAWLILRIPGKKAIVDALEAEGSNRVLWRRRQALDEQECARLAAAVRDCKAGSMEGREKICRGLWLAYAKQHKGQAEPWRHVGRCSEAIGAETGEAGQWLVAADAWRKAAKQAGNQQEREQDQVRANAAKAEMKRLERENRVFVAPNLD